MGWGGGARAGKALWPSVWMLLSVKAKETPGPAAPEFLLKGAFQPGGIRILSAVPVGQEGLRFAVGATVAGKQTYWSGWR